MNNTDYLRASKLAKELIPPRSYVKSCTGGVRVALDDRFEDSVTYFCSDAKLDTVHPHFSAALRVYGSIVPNFRSSTLQRILQLWSTDIFVTNSDGALLGIHQADKLFVDGDYLCLNGGCLTYVEVSDIATKFSLRLALEHYPLPTTICKSWLDQHHPGWQQRLEIAENLDLDKLDCLLSALTKVEVVPSVNLPDSAL